MPQYLYRVQPTRSDMLVTGPTEQEMRAADEHFEYLQSLTSAGKALLVGRTATEDEHTFGVVIFSAADDTEAYAIARGDPAVQQGVMRVEIFPFQLLLWSDSALKNAAGDVSPA